MTDYCGFIKFCNTTSKTISIKKNKKLLHNVSFKLQLSARQLTLIT
jgi:hypothetical protein